MVNGTAGAAAAVRGEKAGEAPVPLSVLDLATVGSGQTAADALRATTETARLAAERGYHRFWVAEHHSVAGVASSSPAVLLAHLAASTDRIRLGSGGVMLPNHTPLVVAEQFGTLEALAPGRIDLGLGRAPGTNGLTAAALRGNDRVREAADRFPQSLTELVRFLDDDFPDGHPYAGVHAVPGPVQGSTSRPPIWLLGSSGFSAELAGRLGLPFSFAHHFAARGTMAALETYRAAFRPSAVLDRPYAMVSVLVLAADDEREARRQLLTSALAVVRLSRGQAEPLATPEEAEAYPFTARERLIADDWLAHAVHGTPDAVRAGLEELAARTGADELMLTANVHGAQARLRSYGLVADAFAMPGGAASASVPPAVLS
ncbi:MULTISPECIES: LLM class flavin-dependent oxidoreductase [unclassified Streptomyces]|uniref:LLM class flavin-dependent oxidoreductase n=1 Tax=unclassified Streptomyces TaxID=2593676 RepID=UPI000CD59F39|nr:MULTISPECIES: LLM class flavin-dependent oxidoreductase [unclassified Streptomyces]